MTTQEKVLREIYTSDIVLGEEEMKMMKNVDDSFFDKLENIHARIEDDQVILGVDELSDLEDSFSCFYFEYGFVQFKRGLELGLSLHHIH